MKTPQNSKFYTSKRPIHCRELVQTVKGMLPPEKTCSTYNKVQPTAFKATPAKGHADTFPTEIKNLVVLTGSKLNWR